MNNDEQARWNKIEEVIKYIKIEEIKDKQIILFGAGSYSAIAREYFEKRKIEIYCYCDNDINKHGEKIGGIPILSPEEIKNIPNKIVFITSRHKVKEVQKQAIGMKIDMIAFDAYCIKENLEDYYETLRNFSDERTRTIFLEIMYSMCTGEIHQLNTLKEDNEFFCLSEFQGNLCEVLIDAGAYVGDTIERFIWGCLGQFEKIYAFEPGEKQYNAMKIRTKRLIDEWALKEGQIECINGGVGEKNNTLFFEKKQKDLASSSFIQATHESGTSHYLVKIYSIDEYLKGNKVTMIKADVEGYEMEMLKGAKNSIKKWKPKLAISIYHKPTDLIEITKYIKEIVPEYNMKICHHGIGLLETVLYCWN